MHCSVEKLYISVSCIITVMFLGALLFWGKQRFFFLKPFSQLIVCERAADQAKAGPWSDKSKAAKSITSILRRRVRLNWLALMKESHGILQLLFPSVRFEQFNLGLRLQFQSGVIVSYWMSRGTGMWSVSSSARETGLLWKRCVRRVGGIALIIHD